MEPETPPRSRTSSILKLPRQLPPRSPLQNLEPNQEPGEEDRTTITRTATFKRRVSFSRTNHVQEFCIENPIWGENYEKPLSPEPASQPTSETLPFIPSGSDESLHHLMNSKIKSTGSVTITEVEDIKSTDTIAYQSEPFNVYGVLEEDDMDLTSTSIVLGSPNKENLNSKMAKQMNPDFLTKLPIEASTISMEMSVIANQSMAFFENAGCSKFTSNQSLMMDQTCLVTESSSVLSSTSEINRFMNTSNALPSKAEDESLNASEIMEMSHTGSCNGQDLNVSRHPLGNHTLCGEALDMSEDSPSISKSSILDFNKSYFMNETSLSADLGVEQASVPSVSQDLSRRSFKCSSNVLSTLNSGDKISCCTPVEPATRPTFSLDTAEKSIHRPDQDFIMNITETGNFPGSFKVITRTCSRDITMPPMDTTRAGENMTIPSMDVTNAVGNYTLTKAGNMDISIPPMDLPRSWGNVNRASMDKARSGGNVNLASMDITKGDVMDVTTPLMDITRAGENVTVMSMDITRPGGGVDKTSIDITRAGENVTLASMDITRPGGDFEKTSMDITGAGENVTLTSMDITRPGENFDKTSMDITRAGENVTLTSMDITRPGGGVDKTSMDITRAGENVILASMDITRPGGGVDKTSMDITRAGENITLASMDITRPEGNFDKTSMDITRAGENVTLTSMDITRPEGDFDKTSMDITRAGENVTLASMDIRPEGNFDKTSMAITRAGENVTLTSMDITRPGGGVDKTSMDITRAGENVTLTSMDITRPEGDFDKTSMDITRAGENVTLASMDITRPEGNFDKTSMAITRAGENVTLTSMDITRPGGGVDKTSMDITRAGENVTLASMDITRPEGNFDKTSMDITRAGENVTLASMDITRPEGDFDKTSMVITRAGENVTLASMDITRLGENMGKTSMDVTRAGEKITQSLMDVTKSGCRDINASPMDIIRCRENVAIPSMDIMRAGENLSMDITRANEKRAMLSLDMSDDTDLTQTSMDKTRSSGNVALPSMNRMNPGRNVTLPFIDEKTSFVTSFTRSEENAENLLNLHSNEPPNTQTVESPNIINAGNTSYYGNNRNLEDTLEQKENTGQMSILERSLSRPPSETPSKIPRYSHPPSRDSYHTPSLDKTRVPSNFVAGKVGDFNKTLQVLHYAEERKEQRDKKINLSKSLNSSSSVQIKNPANKSLQMQQETELHMSFQNNKPQFSKVMTSVVGELTTTTTTSSTKLHVEKNMEHICSQGHQGVESLAIDELVQVTRSFNNAPSLLELEEPMCSLGTKVELDSTKELYLSPVSLSPDKSAKVVTLITRTECNRDSSNKSFMKPRSLLLSPIKHTFKLQSNELKRSSNCVDDRKVPSPCSEEKKSCRMSADSYRCYQSMDASPHNFLSGKRFSRENSTIPHITVTGASPDSDIVSTAACEGIEPSTSDHQAITSVVHVEPTTSVIDAVGEGDTTSASIHDTIKEPEKGAHNQVHHEIESTSKEVGRDVLSVNPVPDCEASFQQKPVVDILGQKCAKALDTDQLLPGQAFEDNDVILQGREQDPGLTQENSEMPLKAKQEQQSVAQVILEVCSPRENNQGLVSPSKISPISPKRPYSCTTKEILSNSTTLMEDVEVNSQDNAPPKKSKVEEMLEGELPPIISSLTIVDRKERKFPGLPQASTIAELEAAPTKVKEDASNSYTMTTTEMALEVVPSASQAPKPKVQEARGTSDAPAMSSAHRAPKLKEVQMLSEVESSSSDVEMCDSSSSNSPSPLQIGQEVQDGNISQEMAAIEEEAPMGPLSVREQLLEDDKKLKNFWRVQSLEGTHWEILMMRGSALLTVQLNCSGSVENVAFSLVPKDHLIKDFELVDQLGHLLLTSRFPPQVLQEMCPSQGDIPALLEKLRSPLACLAQVLQSLNKAAVFFLLNFNGTSVRFEARSVKLRLMFDVTVDLMDWENIQPTQITVSPLFGTIKASDICELVTTIPQNTDFFYKYIDVVREYVKILEKCGA